MKRSDIFKQIRYLSFIKYTILILIDNFETFRRKILFFWLHRAAYGILVPPPRIEPAPSAVKAWSPNHWTARDVPEK